MRSKPTQARSRETVRAVLDAANVEFAEHGFFAAQMTRIADRAGVSPGSMYRFFPDKEDLAAALSEAFLEAFAVSLGPIVAEFTGIDDLNTSIENLLGEVARLQSEHPGYYRLTADVSPLEQRWVDNGVLNAMVETFAVQLENCGCSAVPGADLRLSLEFVIETGRSWLTHLPLDGPVRTKRLDELQLMLTAYLHQRIQGPSEASTSEAAE